MELIDKKKFLEYLDNDCRDVIENYGDYSEFGYSDQQIENAINFSKVNTSIIEWHKITTRLPTNQEIEWYEEHEGETPEYIFDCEMPEDGAEILIATNWGVDKDICCNDWDYGIGLESRGGWDCVLAWAEMPKYDVDGGDGDD